MILSRTACSMALISSLLTACGSVSQPVASTLPVNRATLSTARTSQSAPVAAKKVVKLAPVSAETVQEQAALRETRRQEQATEAAYSPEEEVELRQLEASLADEIAAEDRENDAQKDFAVKSAQQGKDIAIDMFLYNPKYSRRAKFWGIDNAHEFLMAGRSPMRRWLLRRKLEGMITPRAFDQLVLFWVEQADLLRVTGIGRDHAWLLVANGITSVPDLARRNIVELGALRISIGLMAIQYGMDAPTLDELQDWAEEAKTLEPLIY
jgi:hypothetical protein